MGEVGACLDAVSKMFDFSCKGQNQSCAFNDVYQPELQGNFIVSGGEVMCLCHDMGPAYLDSDVCLTADLHSHNTRRSRCRSIFTPRARLE